MHTRKAQQFRTDKKAKKIQRKHCDDVRNIHNFFLFSFVCVFCSSVVFFVGQQDAIHITAILGESVIFNCHVEFPGDHPVPYVLQWEKKVSETVSK